MNQTLQVYLFFMTISMWVLPGILYAEHVTGRGERAFGTEVAIPSGLNEAVVTIRPGFRSERRALGIGELGLDAEIPQIPAHSGMDARMSIMGGSASQSTAIGSGDRKQNERLGGALDLGNGRLSVSLSSSAQTMSDPLQPRIKSTDTSHALNGLFSPVEQLQIEPVVSLRRYQEEWSGLQTASSNAGLGLSYQPTPMLSYRVGGSYGEMIGAGGGTRVNTIDADSGLTLRLPDSRSRGPKLSLDAKYSQSTDAYRDSDSVKAFGGLLRLEIPIN